MVTAARPAPVPPTVTFKAPPAFRVIVNAKNPIERVDKRFVADVFLKKRTRWSDDSVVQPVDQSAKSRVRDGFTQGVLDRTVSAVRRYWAQLVCSGRGVPPPELANDDDVVNYVSTHAGAIGYVSATTNVAGTKVVEVR